MDKGELVPDEVTIKMLESEVIKHPNSSGFILMASQEQLTKLKP